MNAGAPPTAVRRRARPSLTLTDNDGGDDDDDRERDGRIDDDDDDDDDDDGNRYHRRNRTANDGTTAAASYSKTMEGSSIRRRILSVGRRRLLVAAGSVVLIVCVLSSTWTSRTTATTLLDHRSVVEPRPLPPPPPPLPRLVSLQGSGGGESRPRPTRETRRSRTVHHRASADERLRDSEDYPTPERDAFLGLTNAFSSTMGVPNTVKNVEPSDCRPMFAWQTASFPTCNLVHEIDLPRSVSRNFSRTLGRGLYRDVWTLANDGDDEEDGGVVLKTLRYDQPHNDANLDRHRRDAVAAERLTWSPRVSSVHAFCGADAVFERGGATLRRSARLDADAAADAAVPLVEKLRIAAEVARAVADVHLPDPARPGSPTMAHTDVDVEQFLSYVVAKEEQQRDDVDDEERTPARFVFKLTDFNRVRFLRWSERENRTCGFLVAANPGLFRAPEEYALGLETEKVDVFALGNVLVQLYAGRYLPFPNALERNVPVMVRMGERPPIDRDVADDPVRRAFVEAIDLAMAHDPARRSSADEIATLLETRLREIATIESGNDRRRRRLP